MTKTHGHEHGFCLRTAHDRVLFDRFWVALLLRGIDAYATDITPSIDPVHGDAFMALYNAFPIDWTVGDCLLPESTERRPLEIGDPRTMLEPVMCDIVNAMGRAGILTGYNADGSLADVPLADI